MLIYLFTIISALAFLIIISIREFSMVGNNMVVNLFFEGMNDESIGNFKEAIFTYEKALRRIKRNILHDYLKIKIVERLRVLNIIIEYNKAPYFNKLDDRIEILPGISKFELRDVSNN